MLGRFGTRKLQGLGGIMGLRESFLEGPRDGWLDLGGAWRGVFRAQRSPQKEEKSKKRFLFSSQEAHCLETTELRLSGRQSGSYNQTKGTVLRPRNQWLVGRVIKLLFFLWLTSINSRASGGRQRWCEQFVGKDAAAVLLFVKSGSVWPFE